MVTVLCDGGARYQSKLFNPDFLKSKNLPVPGWLERSTLATTAMSLAAWVLLPANPVTAAGFALAALLHAARLWHWQPWRTQTRPILWVLHAAYAWLPVGFLLLAWAQVEPRGLQRRVLELGPVVERCWEQGPLGPGVAQARSKRPPVQWAPAEVWQREGWVGRTAGCSRGRHGRRTSWLQQSGPRRVR